MAMLACRALSSASSSSSDTLLFGPSNTSSANPEIQVFQRYGYTWFVRRNIWRIDGRCWCIQHLGIELLLLEFFQLIQQFILTNSTFQQCFLKQRDHRDNLPHPILHPSQVWKQPLRSRLRYPFDHGSRPSLYPLCSHPYQKRDD